MTWVYKKYEVKMKVFAGTMTIAKKEVLSGYKMNIVI